jgi:hypothetical protein
MRVLFFISVLCLLMFAVGCTTTSDKDRPKILCPACGTELDSIYHTRF